MAATINKQTLNKMCDINREGVSLLGISDAAERIGFRTLGVKLNSEQLKEAELPCILHWRQNHFVVLYKIRNKQYYLADPAVGLVKLSKADFNRNRQGDKETFEGIALLLAPTQQFYEQDDEKDSEVRFGYPPNLADVLIATTRRELIARSCISSGINFD